MKNNAVFLGVDTSNYTTSVAICGYDGSIMLNCKIPLPVKLGERGLRQSDAVFHHVKNLPEAAHTVEKTLWENKELNLIAVGCSQTPRDIIGSYMPCFLPGVAVAEFIAATNNIPVFKFSHQAGHIMAALSSACQNANVDKSKIMHDKFAAFHVSGGTTDVLLCEPDESEIFKITQIGGTKDINAGQAIDRSGVMMNLNFPCGAEMDKAALSYDGSIVRREISVNGMWCNLSGLENKAEIMVSENKSVSEISANVLDFIARTLEKITKNLLCEYGDLPIIYAGGVMSSEYIKKRLSKYGMFADAVCSSDNAVGVALLASEYFKKTVG